MPVSEQQLQQRLFGLLENERHYTLEALSEQLGHPRGDIHRALTRLCRLPGWSIRPVNWIPYGRWIDDKGRRGTHRFREKGEPYEHDWAEPDWERTRYVVRRPTEGAP